MQLNPRYGEPLITVDDLGLDPVARMVEQRERLTELLAGLDDEQWSSPSRCEGWTVQDVVTHLVSTNQFWAYSIAQGLAGRPTEFLANFDPVASPAKMVADAGRPPTTETLASFRETNAALAAAVSDLGDGTWTVLAEAPPGHLSIGCVAMHALWDGLIHELDIALPLGVPTTIADDDLAVALAYAAALSPAFAVSLGSEPAGAIAVRTHEPDVDVVVEVGATVRVRRGEAPAGAVVLEGDTTAVLESLSARGPIDASIAAEDRWMFDGLTTIFDQA